jgi:peptide/nickel transport system substrate-binding protein
VVFKIIPNDAVRIAALLGGDIDLASDVPPSEVGHLERRGVSIFKRPSDRVIFLGCDNIRDESPFVTDADGNALSPNPLKDARVRQAISKAINRRAIVQGVMEGLAAPASQLIPQGWFSHNAELELETYDPVGAKRLLAEAGHPDGFVLTIHGPNNRYINDAKVCQAVAQMLSRVGIQMRVDTMPKSAYFSRLSPPEREFSFYLLGWGSSNVGESTQGLLTVVHSYNKEKGTGTYNGGISLPELDRLAEKASVTVDEAEREGILKAAMAAAMEAYNPIPLYTQFALTAARKGVQYTVRADDQTLAMNARPANP